MRSLVLCAGLGTRLGSLTSDLPKPLLDLGGASIVTTILANLARQDIREVAVNLHFQPQAVVSTLGDGEQLGIRITYSREPRLLGSLGAVKQLEAFLSEEGPYLLHYGDVVTDQHFAELISTHARRDALVTIAVHERTGSNSVAVLESDGRVTRFAERPEADDPVRERSSWAFSGIAVIDPAALQDVPGGPSDLPSDLFPRLVAQQRLYAVPMTGYRCAIDSVERLEEARAAIREGRCRTFVSAAAAAQAGPYSPSAARQRRA
jgi:NDP-sugar pyrophosphorylase family protein